MPYPESLLLGTEATDAGLVIAATPILGWDVGNDEGVIAPYLTGQEFTSPYQLFNFGGFVGEGVIGTANFSAVQSIALTQASSGNVGRFGEATQTIALAQGSSGLLGSSGSGGQALSLSQVASGVAGYAGTAQAELSLAAVASGLVNRVGVAVQALVLEGEAQTGSTAIQAISLGQSAEATYTIQVSQGITLTQVASGVTGLAPMIQVIGLTQSASGARAALTSVVRAYPLSQIAGTASDPYSPAFRPIILMRGGVRDVVLTAWYQE
jgi:hypothetical protein